MRLHGILIGISVFFGTLANAQVGGLSSFDFINVPLDARVAAIGGENISTIEDPNVIFYNPALLDDTLVNRFSASHRPFYGDVNKSGASGVLNFNKIGTIGAGLQFMDYGYITVTNPDGSENGGQLAAREGMIQVSKSHRLNLFSVGVTGKYVFSSLGGYTASALMMDVGGVFHHPKKDLKIGLVAKNIGFAVDQYAETDELELPFDMQLGLSYKLEHMPLRFSTTIHHLQQYDIQYLDPTRDITIDEEGEDVIPTKSTSEKIARHFIFGGEFLFSKHLHFRVGYNHLQRKEMQTTIKKGGAGYSFGVMIKVHAYEMNFTRAYYHAAGGTTALTLSADFDKIITFKNGNK